jgi:hypothetical protein
MGIYTENGSTDVSFEEEEYFADEWVGPGGQANVRTRSLTDCSLYYAQKILQECPIIHGFYIDNIYIRDSLDPETSHAYVLPDGRIQPGFDVWELRDYVRRLRTLLQDMRRNPHGIEVHMTCTMAIPIYGWADCMREGENPVEADNGRKDFADLYPPEFSAIMNNPHPWGVRSVHHWMFYTRFDLFKAIGPDALWKAERTGIGHLALHDNLFPRPEGEPYMRLIKAYDAAFRGAPGPERIVPYWNPQGLVSTKTVFGDCSKDIKVTVYRRAGRIAVWIMNYAREERDAWVWLDLPRLLGDSAYSRDPAVWPYPAYALDLESGEPVKLTEPYAGTEGAGAAYADRRNIVQVKVPARDFRIVLVK